MNKLIASLLIFCLLIFNSFPVMAANDDIYRYEEQKQMTPQEVNIWKYKMERISVHTQAGKWEIIQGINSQLTDMQLLNLVGSENIATERLKNIETKQAIGSGFMLGGLALGAVGAIFLSGIINIKNGTYYGIGGVAGGLLLLVIGNQLSPLVSDESEHIISMEEAKNAAEKYNAQLRKNLNIPDNIQ